MTVDEFRRELVGVPLCGTPETGPLAGKALCTVHLPDGTAILAGAGLVVYGLWEADGGQICRRNQHDPADKQPLRDLRAGRPQPFPQQRRRRLLPRAVRERINRPPRRFDSACETPHLSYDRGIGIEVTMGESLMRAALAGVAIALLTLDVALRRQS